MPSNILWMILEWQNDNRMTKLSSSPCLSIIQRMILEGQNDNPMTEWSSSPSLPIIQGMTLKWQNDGGMTKIHGVFSLKVWIPALASLCFSIIGRQGDLLISVILISFNNHFVVWVSFLV